MKRLLEKKGPLVSGDVWQEVERLKERNRQLHLKMGAERQESIEKISDLEDQLAAQKVQRDKLQAELADREEIEKESGLAGLKENSAPARDVTRQALQILNWLREEVKPFSKKVTLPKIKEILEN